MVLPPNLIVHGKPTPCSERPGSGRKDKTALAVNRARSYSSNIFTTVESADESSVNRTEAKNAKERHYNSVGVVTKSELDAIKALTDRSNPTPEHVTLDKQQGSTEPDTGFYPSARKPAPKGVPKLLLDSVLGKDDDIKYNKVLSECHVESPTSKDTYSWGSPLSKKVPGSAKGGGWQVNQSRKGKTPTSTQRSKKPDDVPDLDLQLSLSNDKLVEMRKVAKQVHQDLRIEYMGSSAPKAIDHLVEKMNSAAPNLKDEMTEHVKVKRRDQIEEAILVDQLTRAFSTDQSVLASPPPPFGLHEKFDSRAQRRADLGQNRALVGGASESSLLKRLRFSARLLTTDGRDARREINGFFFAADSTLTMYEFRQFGTRSNALPFILRGQYAHATGPRAGQMYELHDIEVGADLSFHTDRQTSLPDHLRKKTLIVFRITDVDEAQKEGLLHADCSNPQERRKKREAYESRLPQEEVLHSLAVAKVQGKLRSRLKSRDAKALLNMCQHFQRVGASNNGRLNPNELKQALSEFRLELDEQEFHQVWRIVDRSNVGSLDFVEFVRGFVGEMSEGRKGAVRKAFSRLDPTKTGNAKLSDWKKFYCARKHPKVIQGDLSESQLLEQMCSSFGGTNNSSTISYLEFEAFYEGVSLSYEDEKDFIAMMKSSWSI